MSNGAEFGAGPNVLGGDNGIPEMVQPFTGWVTEEELGRLSRRINLVVASDGAYANDFGALSHEHGFILPEQTGLEVAKMTLRVIDSAIEHGDPTIDSSQLTLLGSLGVQTAVLDTSWYQDLCARRRVPLVEHTVDGSIDFSSMVWEGDPEGPASQLLAPEEREIFSDRIALAVESDIRFNRAFDALLDRIGDPAVGPAVDRILDATLNYIRSSSGASELWASMLVDVGWHEFIKETRFYREALLGRLVGNGQFFHHFPNPRLGSDENLEAVNNSITYIREKGYDPDEDVWRSDVNGCTCGAPGPACHSGMGEAI